nr:hypothetical protein [Tanacetum cinerariifolium]
MTNERETTPPPGFLTSPHIPNINTTERPPVTTTMFATTTPGNTLFAYRASTLTDLAPMISPALVEANHEIFESHLRDRRRHIRNEDLRTKLEYFSEDYDEELKMEPRPERTREVTLLLRTRSARVRRERESQKAGSILNYEDLKAKFRSHFSQQKRFTKTHLAFHIIKQREGESVRAFATRYTDDTLQILGLHEDQQKSPLMELRMIEGITSKGQRNLHRNGRGQRSRDRFSPYRGPNHGLLSSLSKSLREILATEKIEEAVRSGQLSYLVKGIKKERKRTSDNQREEKKEKSTTPAEAPILMIDWEEACIRNNVSKGLTFERREITFSPVDLHVSLVGFSGKKSWAVGEVRLEITIGNAPLTSSETLNFFIVRYSSIGVIYVLPTSSNISIIPLPQLTYMVAPLPAPSLLDEQNSRRPSTCLFWLLSTCVIENDLKRAIKSFSLLKYFCIASSLLGRYHLSANVLGTPVMCFGFYAKTFILAFNTSHMAFFPSLDRFSRIIMDYSGYSGLMTTFTLSTGGGDGTISW